MVEEMKHTELGNIPNDWDVKTLGDVGEVKMCRRVFNHETKSQGPIPFYKIGTFGKEADAYISMELYNNYRQRFSFPRKGDILISAAGTIGRTLIYDGKPAYFQDSNIVWIDNDEKLIPNEFLNHVFKVVKYNTEGGTIQRLYNSILKSTKFLCPPTKAERTAIATTLNDADALVHQLEQLISKKIAIKNEISRDLLSGNKRIGSSSEKWDEVSIEKLCKTFTKQTGFDYSAHIKPKLVTNYFKGVIPFIQNKDFNGYNVNFNTDYFIPLSVAKDFPRILLDEKCLLISISGSIGNVGVFNNNQVAFLGGAIAVAKFHDHNLIDWAMYYLKSPNGQNMMVAKVKKGSHQNLILDDIRKMLIPIPPKNEMQKIVTILYDMDIEIQELERKLEKYKMMKQGMMQSLLTGKIRLVV